MKKNLLSILLLMAVSMAGTAHRYTSSPTRYPSETGTPYSHLWHYLTAGRDPNLALGNPSNAKEDGKDPNNVLLNKPQYSISYNNAKGIPNWVSWHLSKAWKGDQDRCDCFNSDDQLTADLYHATQKAYTNTGFDKGHVCPSEDRDGSEADNRATFLMTNMVPQAPKNNQVTWKNFETYLRTLLDGPDANTAADDNEAYIIAGQYGVGGIGKDNTLTKTIADGKITVPSNVWKIAVLIPVGENDPKRIVAGTRVIAVDMPNVQTVTDHPWQYYRVSVDHLEEKTGYNFLSVLSKPLQKKLESQTDNL